MNRSLSSLLLAVTGAALALAVSRLLGFTGAVDAALPFWVLLASLAGAVAISEAAAQRIALAIPLMLGAAIAIPDERARHLAYGLVLAASFAAAVVDVAREGTLSRGRAIALAMLVLATRAFPFDGGAVGWLAVVAIGTAALVLAACHPEPYVALRAPQGRLREGSGWGRRETRGRESADPSFPRSATTNDGGSADDDSASCAVHPPRSLATLGMTSFLLVVAIGLVTPLAPWDATLIPLVVAMAFFASRGFGRPQAAPTVAMTIVSLLLALVVGKWMAAAVAIVLASAAARTYPGTANAVRRYGPYLPLVAAALVAALALFARPHPAVILVLIALLVLAREPGARSASLRASAVAGALLFGTIALSPWSGAAAAAFPLFAERGLWIPFAAVAAAAALLPFPRTGAIVGAAAFAAFALFLPKAPVHVEPVRTAIAPGESFVLAPPGPTRAVEIVISGANVSGLDAGTLLGRLDVVDAAGEAYARPIRVGDLADWGAFRSGDLFRTRNPLPLRPGWTIEGEGREAMLRGDGKLRVRLERPVGRIVVAADAALPPDARLQIERMEVAPE